ncbi:putative transcriptional regulator cudA [Agrilus planipennis]|uniref:Transcriptional regulator cudA n=1 Tax=Agrilus planipennis TaxID=224129 RepID=A0A1W4WXC8_AGRPL|nr:putative transcriptional regulator cudA [Agrilus planipennis]
MFLQSVKFLLLIVTCGVQVCHPIPIFSNQGLTTLLTRASTPPQTSNILDLRGSKINKFENQEGDSLNNTSIDSEPEEPDNEVVPSLLNKKINKILQKIQLITSLSNGFLQGSKGENDGDMNYENTDDNDDNDNKPDTTIFTGGNNTTTTSSFNENLKETTSNNDESFRIVFDTDVKRRTEDKYDKLEEFDEMKPTEVTKSKSRSESPSGQFLPLTLIASVMQTLGSIMGHAYRSLIYFSQQNRDNH